MDMVELEIVKGCFLDCRWCPIEKDSEPRFMSIDIFTKALNQIIEDRLARKRLRFFGAGEPLLHPQLGELLKIAARLEINKYSELVDFSTNGMLLTADTAQMIVDSDVINEFRFSVDGLGDKETFEYIRRGARWEKVVQNVNLMQSLCEKKGGRTYCAIECTSPHTGAIPEELEKFREGAEERLKKTFPGVKLYTRGIHRYDGKIELEGMPPFLNLEGICNRMQWNWMKVTWDGRISRCLQDARSRDHSIGGNIDKDRMREIWFSNDFRKFRKMIYQGRHREIEMCKDCDVILTDPAEIKRRRRKWFWTQYIPELLKYGPIR